MLCHNEGEFEKKKSISVYLQNFYRRLAAVAYKTQRNFVSEGDLIKYTLNFEFKQVHFSSSPRGETKLLWQQNVLVFHVRAICRETNVIFVEASLGNCPEHRKIELMWGCTHKHKN